MTFQPTKKPTRIAFRNIKLEVSPERYEELKGHADRAGISLKEFVRQAVDYAVAEIGNG